MIIAIVAPPYGGKTLYLTYVVWDLIENKKWCKVAYTNYWTKYSKVLDNLNQLNEIDYLGDAGVLVGLDDIIPWLDNRQSEKNTYTTWIFNQYRKRGLIIFYTQQTLSTYKRLHNITDRFIFSREIKFPFFEIKELYPDGTSIAPYVIKYTPVIYEAYKTLEIVESRVSYARLRQEFGECGKKGIFAKFMRRKFNISIADAELLFELINDDNESLLKRFFRELGYTLIA